MAERRRADRSEARKKIEAVFDVVLDELERNPRFADRLIQALGEMTTKTAPAGPPPAAADDDESDEAPFHAVTVLRSDGAGLLRGRLERLRSKKSLRAVARRSGLVLTGAGAKRTASVAELVDAIVRAAEHYDAQRKAAAQ